MRKAQNRLGTCIILLPHRKDGSLAAKESHKMSTCGHACAWANERDGSAVLQWQCLFLYRALECVHTPLYRLNEFMYAVYLDMAFAKVPYTLHALFCKIVGGLRCVSQNVHACILHMRPMCIYCGIMTLHTLKRKFHNMIILFQPCGSSMC